MTSPEMRFRSDTSTPPLAGSRAHGDGGTALIELALVLPFFFAVTMGIMEIGFMTKNNITLTTALRLSTRADAQAMSFTDRRYADYDALDMFRSMAAEQKSTNLVRLVIYKPTNSAGAAPGTCLTVTPQVGTGGSGVGSTGNCNVFGKDQLAALGTGTTKTDRFGATSATATCDSNDWDRFWCPVGTSRDNQLLGGLDSICFYAEYTYTYVTKVIPGNTRKVTDKACMQVEPAM